MELPRVGRERVPASLLFHAKSHPPLEPLRAVIATLERAGIPCALGGSGLLAALGLTASVRDWDLQVDAPARLVYPQLDPARTRYVGSDALHADEKVELPEDRIEVICRFAFFTPDGIVELPAAIGERREGLPLACAEVWAVAYWLLEREAKAAALLAHLEAQGARAELIDALLAQPLPPALSGRLRRLAPRGPSSSP